MSREKKLVSKFSPAVLKNRSGDLSKRWYIEYKVWDEASQKLIRQHDYLPNALKTEKERLEYGKARVATINNLLARGFCLNGNPIPKPEDEKPQSIYTFLSLQQALDWALDFKKAELRIGSHARYRNVRDLFYQYAPPELKEKPINKVNENDILGFYQYITLETEYLAKDHIKTLFKGLFSLLVRERIIAENPCPKIIKQRRRTGKKNLSRKNKAFTEEQFKSILTYLKKNDKELYRFVVFMFYTFARPKFELRLLKIGDIDLRQEKITVAAEHSKNNYERRVDISPHLLNVIQDMDLQKYPQSYYIFGRDGKPGKEPRGKETYYMKFRAALHALKLDEDPDLTFYSIKHTGIVMHFLAGVDVEALKEQTGHRDWDSFWVYLKSLNLITNDRFKAKSPRII
ncbi:tyrosine-type recombinase/integrase [Xanthocytophaga agilis]|uniref:Tyrosine-type recombinase/integrase n=1 Tax=Xanthocytophaga agilis TaxID=3048010 RepID=A0AAE3UEN2_9BACT|nr:tyrosine-type recombinase/integrase [Xanthocytophaga agilis]MDJ1500447.1 tyrosine-type recombinase/integrase [Xanthocytophaga agilis]